MAVAGSSHGAGIVAPGSAAQATSHTAHAVDSSTEDSNCNSYINHGRHDSLGHGEPQEQLAAAVARELSEEEEDLVREVSVAALEKWLSAPGSDVEKALKQAMRRRHTELRQETRKQIAASVLGVAVTWGQLRHLLARRLLLGPESPTDASLLYTLQRLRALREEEEQEEEGNEENMQEGMEKQVEGSRTPTRREDAGKQNEEHQDRDAKAQAKRTQRLRTRAFLFRDEPRLPAEASHIPLFPPAAKDAGTNGAATDAMNKTEKARESQTDEATVNSGSNSNSNTAKPAQPSGEDAAEHLAAEASLPLWLARRWLRELGFEETSKLGAAMLKPARVTLRTNVLKASREDLLHSFSERGVRALPTEVSPVGIWLPDGRPPGGGVWQLPGFLEGLFEVQDEGSQIIVQMTEAQPGDRVLDYCAGRGGKTWGLVSMVAPTGEVLAWDIDANSRKQIAGARAARVGAAAKEGQALVRVLEDPPTPSSLTPLVDVALVDAPCSSIGVLRRHPSQRWAVGEEDVAAVSKIQLEVLTNAARLVRPGGRLVYATCSLLREENSDVAAAFQASPVGANYEPWPIPGRPSNEQTLYPHIHGTDGFFMARWKRKD